jgi:NAD(P)-dependent dehydrogenase (short-subunit alcohol dehydrogenase family)
MGLWRDFVDGAAELSVVGSFSRVGIALRRGGFVDDIPDLRGRRVVITGATSGIGLCAASALAARHADVVLVGRDPRKLALAQQQVPSSTTLRCDLSDLDDVAALGRALRAAPPDVLVHNAGLLAAERVLTRQGHEQCFAVHVLAPFLLDRLLADRLAAGARVVWVTSGGMYTQRLDPVACEARTGRYDGVEAYAQQKRAQVLLSEDLATSLQPRGVTSNAMHPGWATTPGLDRGLPTFARVMGPLLRSPEEGADTLVWLCASPAVHAITGRLFHDRRPRRTEILPGTHHPPAVREALVARCTALTDAWA